jgi:hypothetical protein
MKREKTERTAMFDRDSLYDHICDAVNEWVPKHAEAPEVTPEENERRFQEALKLIKGITHERLIDLMGEEWLAEFRKVAQ